MYFQAVCRKTVYHLRLRFVKLRGQVYSSLPSRLTKTLSTPCCALLENFREVHGADVMYHKNCLSNYLRKFERVVEVIMNPPVSIVDNLKLYNLFLDFVKTINLRSHAYSFSDCRQLFNEILGKEKPN